MLPQDFREIVAKQKQTQPSKVNSQYTNVLSMSHIRKVQEITNRSVHFASKQLKEDEEYLSFPEAPRTVARSLERQLHIEKMMMLNNHRQNIAKQAKIQGALINYFKSPKVKKYSPPDITTLIIAAKPPPSILNCPPNQLPSIY